MSNRLNKEKEADLQPKGIEYACNKLQQLGIPYMADGTKVCFQWKGSQVTLYPYSGWHTGKTIIDGRGINNLLKQLNP